jgi:hypothetical protein
MVIGFIIDAGFIMVIGFIIDAGFIMVIGFIIDAGFIMAIGFIIDAGFIMDSQPYWAWAVGARLAARSTDRARRFI